MFGVFQSKAQLTYGRPQLLNNPISVEWFSVFIARRSTVMHQRSELSGACEVNSAGDPGGLSGSANHPHTGDMQLSFLVLLACLNVIVPSTGKQINDHYYDDYGGDDQRSNTMHSNPAQAPVHVLVCLSSYCNSIDESLTHELTTL